MNLVNQAKVLHKDQHNIHMKNHNIKSDYLISPTNERFVQAIVCFSKVFENGSTNDGILDGFKKVNV